MHRVAIRWMNTGARDIKMTISSLCGSIRK